MTTATRSGKGGKPARSKVEEREVIYPEVETVREVLTIERIKELLGWKTVQQNGIPEIERKTGEKVTLDNNVKNRPILWPHVEELSQEFLNRDWKFNGASVSIGKTGLVMSFQHRGLGAIFAEWERTLGPNAKRWQELNPDPITLDTVVVYGIEEDDATFASLNREKAASFADTLYRSDWFPKTLPGTKKVITGKLRKYLSRLVDHAVKFLWMRTGAKVDPFAPKRTPTEALRFIENHKKVLDAVFHIFTIDEEKRDEDNKKLPRPVGRFVPAGYAAALLYLMATSESDGDGYRDVNSVSDRSEKKLKFTRMDRAKEFWSGVAGGEFEAVRATIASLADGKGGAEHTTQSAAAVMSNAWNYWVDGGDLTSNDKDTIKKLYPYDKNKKGNLVLIDTSVNGIDTAGMKKDEIRGNKGDMPETPTAPVEEEPDSPEVFTEADKHRRRQEAKRAKEVAAAEANGASDEDVPAEDDVPVESGYEE